MEILAANGEEPEVINYLENPPSAEELKRILEQLKIRPIELIRQKEMIFQEKF